VGTRTPDLYRVKVAL